MSRKQPPSKTKAPSIVVGEIQAAGVWVEFMQRSIAPNGGKSKPDGPERPNPGREPAVYLDSRWRGRFRRLHIALIVTSRKATKPKAPSTIKRGDSCQVSVNQWSRLPGSIRGQGNNLWTAFHLQSFNAARNSTGVLQPGDRRFFHCRPPCPALQISQ